MKLTRRRALGSLTALAAALTTLEARALFGAGPSLGVSEFLEAVSRGDLEAVDRALAETPALARSRDDRGRSAFVLAFLGGHPEVARRLRAVGLELDAVEAVLAEEWDRLEALVEQDPRLLHAAHPIGGTPLYAGALAGSVELWRLRSLGCDPDAAPEGGSGFTPARGALESPRRSWARIGLTDLCGNGADVNAPQAGGSSVLHAAVARRDVDLVRLAIRKGARPEARDEAGRTPLELARVLEWEAGVELLESHEDLPRDNRASRFALDANREPVRRPDLSEVPRELQSRVTGNSHFRLEAVRELVAQDERLVWSISTDDELAIEASAHMGSRDLMRFHLDHGAPLSLPTAVSLGDLESVRFWLDRDVTLIHERGAHDFPLFWYVVQGGSLDAGELLLERGADVDQESMGTTALHFCAKRGRHECAHWLLEHGADPNAVGYKWSRGGDRPLGLAPEGSRTATVLRDAGAR